MAQERPRDGTVHLTVPPGQEMTRVAEDGAIVITVREGATLRYRTSGSGTRTISLASGASLDWIDTAIGTGRCAHEVRLDGEGADAKYRSLMLGNDEERVESTITIFHNAPRTTSGMLSRAALLGKSAARYLGTVRIAKGARGCEAHQREDTLLLDQGKAEATPVLEVAEDDVRCGHSATLGRINQSHLFYLQSKGIARADATRMLVQGFFDQLLISMGGHGEKARQVVQQRLEALHG